MFFPGAETLVLDAGHVTRACGVNVPHLPVPINGVVESAPTQAYDIDLAKPIACAIPPQHAAYNKASYLFSTPPAYGSESISIRGIHWFVETNAADGAIWISFDEPTIVYR
jgi:hypothetical protein